MTSWSSFIFALLIFAIPLSGSAEIQVDIPVDPPREQPVTTPAPDGTTAARPQPKELSMAIDLHGGSHIIGTPAIETLSVKTAYASMDISLKKIAAIKIAKDNKTISLDFHNGDTLSGELALEAITLNTLFGKTSIDVKLIESIEINYDDPNAPVPLKGMVLYFGLNKEGNIAEDKSGTGNNGTIVGAVFEKKARKRGGYYFDGNGDRITINNNKTIELTQAVTASAWMKLKSFGPGGYGNENGYVINKGKSINFNPTMFLGYRKGSSSRESKWPGKPGPYEAVFQIGGQNGSKKAVLSKTKMKIGEWYHVTGTFDGKALRIYINGKLEKTEAYVSKIRSDRAPIIIGGGSLMNTGWGNHFTFNGTADEIRIYNRAISDAEARRVYQASK